MRAVGAGHAWSDVALTDGYLRADRTSSAGSSTVDGAALVRVLGGTAPARPQRGARRARARAAATWAATTRRRSPAWSSTSTHGSGLELGPVPGHRPLARPRRGGGGRASCASSRRATTQVRRAPSAAWARSASSTRCVIEVREKFWLHEVRTVDTWERVRDDRHAGRRARRGRPLRAVRQPVRGQGRRAPRSWSRAAADCPEPAGEPRTARAPPAHRARVVAPDHRRAAALRRAALAAAAGLALRRACWRTWRTTPTTTSPTRSSTSARRTGCRPYSMELGVTLEGDRHLEAVDRILAIAARRAAGGAARPHLADRAALRRALAGVRVDDARAADDDDRADPGRRHARRRRAAGRLRGASSPTSACARTGARSTR